MINVSGIKILFNSNITMKFFHNKKNGGTQYDAKLSSVSAVPFISVES